MSSTPGSVPSTPRALMELWGGALDKGLCTVKRLEVDFSTPLSSVLQSQGWTAVFRTLSSHSMSIGRDSGSLSYLSSDALMIVTRQKVVCFAGKDCPLHNSLVRIIEMLAKEGNAVNWMMFSKKSSVCLWDEADASMAGEYATLQLLCAGHSYLLGPVDADHFFCFVHDSIDRSCPTFETDVQVNLVMYEASEDVEYTQIQWHYPPTKYTEFQGETGYSFVADGSSPGSYCVLRTEGDVVFFETNSEDAVEYTADLAELVHLYRPTRFSLFILLDPHCKPSQDPVTISHNQLIFDGFKTESKSSNEFAHGYIATRMNFIRRVPTSGMST